MSKSFIFLVKSFLGDFYRHLVIFTVTLINIIIHLFLGCRQELWQGDGAENEQAAFEPQQHAQGGPTHEHTQPSEYSQVSLTSVHLIDAVNQGNWSLSIKLSLECCVIVE